MYSGSLREAKANAPSASGSTLAGANGSPSVAPHSGHGRDTSSKRGGGAPGSAAAASGEAPEATSSSGIIATADPYRDSRLFPIASRTRHRGVAEEREPRPYNRAVCEGLSPRARSLPLIHTHSLSEELMKTRLRNQHPALPVLALALGAAGLSACGALDEPAADDVASAATSSVIKFVFVVTMENHDANQIYGNTTDAPYINNTLIPQYAHATNFNDELPSLVSEPHYVWM